MSAPKSDFVDYRNTVDHRLYLLKNSIDEIPREIHERLTELIGIRVLEMQRLLEAEVEKYKILFERQKQILENLAIKVIECDVCGVGVPEKEATWCKGCVIAKTATYIPSTCDTCATIEPSRTVDPNRGLVCLKCNSVIAKISL